MIPKILSFDDRKLISLLSILKVDIYFALILASYKVPSFTITQLIQDKYCINHIKLSPVECLNLESLGVEYDEIANQIYTYSATIANYKTIILTIPPIVLSIFIGHWIDKHPNKLKYVLVTPCLGFCLSQLISMVNVFYFKLDAIHLLWSSMVEATCGGYLIAMIATYTHLTWTTKVKYRAVRFAVLELLSSVSMPIGSAIGGKIITVEPWFKDQYRNFLLTFIVAFGIDFVALIWITILFNSSEQLIIEDVAESVESKSQQLGTKRAHEKVSEPKADSSLNTDRESNISAANKSTGCTTIVLDIFNLSAVVDPIRVCCRARPNYARSILWHLLLSMIVMLLGYMSDYVIGMQFTQKVYHWDVSYYSYINSAMSLIPALINPILPIIFAHKLNSSDTILFIIGSVSFVLSLTIKGGLLESYAFYVATVVGLFTGLLPCAIRSIISRIIDPHEAGQVFAVLSCIEGLGAAASSILYSLIFNLTIQTLPGTAYHMTALLGFYPLIVSFWLDIKRFKWDPVAMKTLTDQKNQRKCCESLEKESILE